MLETAPREAASAAVAPNAKLTPDGLAGFLEAARQECSARRVDPLLNLTSTDSDLVQSALFDCLGPGRRDPRYLKLVRSSLLAIDDEKGFWSAVHLLAHATNHPDIAWSSHNWIERDVAEKIQSSFRWTPPEIAMMLARMPEEDT
jgi:hypothetical protein